MPGKYRNNTSSNSMDLKGVQSKGGMKRYADKIRKAFQDIIGDCAKITVTTSGTETVTIGSKSIVRDKYRIDFNSEKQNCVCDPCWRLLKAAIQNTGLTVQIQYAIDRDNAFAYTGGNPRNVYFNPGIGVYLPEKTNSGKYRDRRVPSSVALWHEAIAHAVLGLQHPNIPANNFNTLNPPYIDPVIKEENLARECTRLQGKKYGKLFGLFFGHELGERHPAYYGHP
jgi:hypothetical protein